MKAVERTIQQLLHSGDRYVIPIFQRYYIWKKINWDQLWEDLQFLLETNDKQPRHFLGSLVCVPETHQPGTIPAYQVIDGQQRLATLSIMLCSIRDTAKKVSWDNLAAEINETYLIHKFKRNYERYKLFPRLRDRHIYFSLVDGKSVSKDSQIENAYKYFLKRIRKEGLGDSQVRLRRLFDVLTTRIDMVAITLEGENPYKIFKSLNSTGVDLDHGDLIRNHVFMSLPIIEQDFFDDKHWKPLEHHFERNGKLHGVSFAAFFRDVLMRSGSYVGKDATYEAFEQAHPLSEIKPKKLLEEFENHANHYDIICGNSKHPAPIIDKALRDIHNLNVSVSNPLILKLLELYDARNINTEGLVESLESIAGFVLRRYVCGESSRAYARWFCTACRELGYNAAENLIKLFQEKGWPDNNKFMSKFTKMNLYKSKYCRAILEGLELLQQRNSEPVETKKCTIEHVMPQKIEDDNDGRAWMETLDENWDYVHRKWLHTPGNLTLVGYDYNISMQKKPFSFKRLALSKSKVYMNKYFDNESLHIWNEAAIKKRGAFLASLAVNIWKGPPKGKNGGIEGVIKPPLQSREKLKVTIDWKADRKHLSTETICETVVADTMAKIMERLADVYKTSILDQIASFKIGRGPMVSIKPEMDFVNRKKNKPYGYKKIGKTNYYVLTHSSTDEKIEHLKQMLRHVKLPENLFRIEKVK